MIRPNPRRNSIGTWGPEKIGKINSIELTRNHSSRNVWNWAGVRPSISLVYVIDDVGERPAQEVGQKRQDEWTEEHQREARNRNLRDEGQGRLLDLRHGLEQRDG